MSAKQDLSPLSNAGKTLKPGRYAHYKGGRYLVIGVAREETTHREMVVYQALYGDQFIWTRPLQEFLESVEVDGRMVTRFTPVNVTDS